MIITVTPNAALDVTMRIEDVEWGESNRIAPAVRRAGGKGLNVGRVLTQMGEHAHVVAAVGQDDHAFFARDLGTVPHTLLLTPDRLTRRSLAIVEGAGAPCVTVLNEGGRPMDESVWSEMQHLVRTLTHAARALVIAGSTPPDFGPVRLANLIATGVDARLPVIADVSGPDLLVAADCRAELLKPNRRELREATGESDPLSGARCLIERGAAAVVVSSGEEGMLLATRAGAVRGSGPVVAGNPTGAGDAAVASLAAHLAAGVSDPAILIARAIAWATASLHAPEAGVLGVDPTPILSGITVRDVWSPS